MTIEYSLFFFFAATLIITSLVAVANRNPIYSVVSLIMTFFSIAGLFVMLEAYFLAALELLVYAGAIMVFFIFVIMLLNLKKEYKAPNYLAKFRLMNKVLLCGFVLIMAYLFWNSFDTITNIDVPIRINFGNVESVAYLLFTKYLLPFEVASILLLAALIGAIYISKRNIE